MESIQLSNALKRILAASVISANWLNIATTFARNDFRITAFLAHDQKQEVNLRVILDTFQVTNVGDGSFKYYCRCFVIAGVLITLNKVL